MSLSRKTVVKGATVSIGSFLLFGIVTGLLPNPLYVRMVPRTLFDYIFLVVTSLFAGAYVAQQPTTNRSNDDRLAFSSVIAGFLAFGCPICNVFLLALFSNSVLMTYFDPYRPVLGAVSVVLFAGLLYYRQRYDCQSCA
ncbi:hypothetical protein [Halocatena pleomorpha]|uniref:Uncharacterized protein n=1 Tax=Halocatena pleomorpha TaxID=1785090 RepID=A0A3P3RA44_9EURY|nr:hypothetical protein [Halocatena pleomorpha]RRJ29560.1 hypothetical protein EIK79_13060 [Halocatena pleomorpha]